MKVAGMDLGKFGLSEEDRALLESVQVYRRNVRRLTLRVRDGKPSLIVPPGMSMETVASFAVSKIGWLKKVMARAEIQTKNRPVISRTMLPEFMSSLKKIVAVCEEEMNVQVRDITVKLMKSRWGSCTPATRRISINFALAAFDEDVLRYVVVHEMAHIFEPNHSARFWTIVERYCPDFRIQRKLLKDSPMPLFKETDPDISAGA